jgi:hypothetical protein
MEDNDPMVGLGLGAADMGAPEVDGTSKTSVAVTRAEHERFDRRDDGGDGGYRDCGIRRC